MIAPLSADATSPSPIDLDRGWQYRWGDSPLDPDGTPKWTYEDPSSSAWRDTEQTIDPPDRASREFLWLRIRLPDIPWRDPALFLTSVISAAEIYLDAQKIYATSPLEANAIDRYSESRWHLFRLPPNPGDRTLFFRIYAPGSPHIGLPLLADNRVLIGEQDALVSYVIRNSIDRFALGCLFVLVGLLSIDLFFHRWRQQTYHYLSFGAFAACAGLAFAASSELAQWVIPSPALRFNIAIVGVLFFPVGLFSFYEQIVESGHQRLLRRIWQIFLVYGVALLLLQWLGIVRFQLVFLMIWAFILAIGYGVGFLCAIKGAFQENVQAKIFNIGFLVTILLGAHDLLFSFEIIPYWRWLSPWGVLFFILCLTHIIEQKNAADQEQLQSYSRELEEYSQTLEEKVDQRTRDLREKNRQLETTMRQLRETQEQLVLREKMASLGKLVAGVAHEINNPIGAVRSAADVTARAVERIVAAFDGDESRITRAVRIFADNNRILLQASERIARIVRSLREFAHLDEATFQDDVDVRAGIENALILLENQLDDRITVVRDLAAVPPISCYPSELNQVFMNLLENAAEAIDGSGAITVRTRSHETHIHIEIVDTGRGIPPERIERIFDPGVTSKGTGVGTGLGLSTSYSIVQKHAGEIRVASKVEKGTTFTIILPVKVSPENDLSD